ncbi:predicted protein [Sclerotinia sclerotiorum 1980 UF-70]|uniref:Uncharacterized protein n=1 Tax=Sclerotinia sclerotiorum (strain ATCC 18683 / 1980 / Ss-1) TaxID=665079 RepID=A7EH74_SCLS1|nr:predicted protein [Sclerotinia sclerotiorum 1980 UF-70]EDO02190.1 predicted protein [Sclerotinia sclerotiorum 1980 UF-70]
MEKPANNPFSQIAPGICEQPFVAVLQEKVSISSKNIAEFMISKFAVWSLGG